MKPLPIKNLTSALAILQEIKKVWRNPKRWTIKLSEAEDGEQLLPRSDDVCRVCLLGGVDRFGAVRTRETANKALIRAAEQMVRDGTLMYSFDVFSSTSRTMMEALNRAIKNLSAKQRKRKA